MFLLNSNKIYLDTIKNAFTIQNVPIKYYIQNIKIEGIQIYNTKCSY